jgi:hypothetical protein
MTIEDGWGLESMQFDDTCRDSGWRSTYLP